MIRRLYVAKFRFNHFCGVKARRIAYRQSSSSVHFLARDSLDKINCLLSGYEKRIERVRYSLPKLPVQDEFVFRKVD